MIEGEDTEGRR